LRAFRDLKVWRKSHELTLAVYKMTSAFPKAELFGLTSQIRRASGSIGANIAEGCGRASGPDLGRFLQIAFGSASELENHILLARDLGLLNDSDYNRLDGDVTELKECSRVSSRMFAAREVF